MGYNSHLKLDLNHITPLKHAMRQASGAYSNMGSNYSVTSLYQPPRVIQLQKRYNHLLKGKELDPKEDGTTDWYRAMKSTAGTAVHNYLEYNLRRYISEHPELRYNDKTKTGYMLERRLWYVLKDRKISGQFDLWLNKVMYDWKLTSTWKWVKQDFKDYEMQINLYGYLCQLWDIPMEAAYMILWFTDWKTNNYEKGYPTEPVKQVSVPVWEPEEQKRVFLELLDKHITAEDLPDDELPECTESERWASPAVFAVMKKGQKKAARVAGMTTYEIALEWVAQKPETDQDQYYINHRVSKSTRCEDWCDLNIYCSQYKRMQEEKAK